MGAFIIIGTRTEINDSVERTTLTSGTVMHGTKLPIMYWYIAMHFLTSMKKSFLALEMQR